MVYLDETDDIAACQDRRAQRAERALIWSLTILGLSFFWPVITFWIFK
ncbi:hypothetical protein OSJ77_19830 [Phyllobacterium sp. 0TCS1.6C]|nr:MULTISPECIES: hypothetical protein [unclassified Phyllobacterium]MCX8282444.1 hypothetical protein [Phyllobacterium sp. 0TCS1.6C]MCX8292536.1 hypothetical protein [Phyllobacterium sp. 0TCS1.6A]